MTAQGAEKPAVGILDASPTGAYRAYTGVGSRSSPADVMNLMTSIASELGRRGWVLRSGGASGADQAFEAGLDASYPREIYLPYRGFNGSGSPLYTIRPECFDIARSVHPAWHRLNEFGRKAHARNVYQVKGAGLDRPSAALICWTEDGAIDAASSSKSGGTRTAIVLAAMESIPVFNLARPEHRAALEDWLASAPAPPEKSQDDAGHAAAPGWFNPRKAP